MSIELHPTLGVNPHLGMCPRCGKDNGELLLIGNRVRIMQCNECGSPIYGHRASEPCPKCGQNNREFTMLRVVDEREKIPSGLCQACKDEIEEHAEIVRKGGVYFKCAECGCTGVLRETARLAEAVRERSGIKAPDPVGIEFEKCAEHTPASG